MSDTVITIEDEETPAPPVIVETDSDESTGEAAAAAAAAVAEVLAETERSDAVEHLANEAHRAELERENADLKAAAAFEAGRRAAEVVADVEVPAPILEDDEVVAPQTHGWFRPMSEWRGER